MTNVLLKRSAGGRSLITPPYLRLYRAGLASPGWATKAAIVSRLIIEYAHIFIFAATPCRA